MKGDRMKRHAVWSSLFVVILAVLIDQGIKYLVESRMFYGQQIDLLPFLALFARIMKASPFPCWHGCTMAA